MALDLSIIIPSKETLFEKDYYLYSKGEKVFKEIDSSLWQTAIYELWDEDDIYSDLSERIKDLTDDIDCAEYHEDFSKKTQDELQAEKQRVVEGVKILSKVNYPGRSALLRDMERLLKAGEQYINKRNQIAKTMVLVQKLEYRILQLQVDVHTGEYEEISIFKKELMEIKKEFNFLQELGANDQELKRLRSLIRAARQEIKNMQERNCD